MSKIKYFLNKIVEIRNIYIYSKILLSKSILILRMISTKSECRYESNKTRHCAQLVDCGYTAMDWSPTKLLYYDQMFLLQSSATLLSFFKVFFLFLFSYFLCFWLPGKSLKIWGKICIPDIRCSVAYCLVLSVS